MSSTTTKVGTSDLGGLASTPPHSLVFCKMMTLLWYHVRSIITEHFVIINDAVAGSTGFPTHGWHGYGCKLNPPPPCVLPAHRRLLYVHKNSFQKPVLCRVCSSRRGKGTAAPFLAMKIKACAAERGWNKTNEILCDLPYYVTPAGAHTLMPQGVDWRENTHANIRVSLKIVCFPGRDVSLDIEFVGGCQ